MSVAANFFAALGSVYFPLLAKLTKPKSYERFYRKAEAILQYRKEHGPFQTIEELMQVSGIGEALFEKIKNRVKI